MRDTFVPNLFCVVSALFVFCHEVMFSHSFCCADTFVFGFVVVSFAQVTQLLQYWMRLTSENPGEEEKTGAAFLHVLHQRNVLKTDEVRSKVVAPDTSLVGWGTD